VSGISQQEAAELLKTTPKAIEMRLRRARKKLAQSLPSGEG
jgi:DNA-directed RNA polymerase specialized sigma24 family protein